MSFMTIGEYAKKGAPVSAGTLRRMVKLKEIPGFYQGTRFYIDVDSFEKELKARSMQTITVGGKKEIDPVMVKSEENAAMTNEDTTNVLSNRMEAKKMDEIWFENKEITPEEAAKLLEKNLSNRKLAQPVVARYARDMAAGRWELNGATICVDKDGNLTDGQHRLSAVVSANVPVRMTIAHNVPFSSTLDIGKTRNIADSLRMEYGIANIDSKVVGDINVLVSIAGGARKLTPVETLEVFRLYEKQITFLQTIPNTKSVGSPVRAAAFVALRDNGCKEESVDRFFRVLTTGYGNGTEDNTAVAFRNFYLSNKALMHGGASERKSLFGYAYATIIAYANGSIAQRVSKPKYPDLSYVREIYKKDKESDNNS